MGPRRVGGPTFRSFSVSRHNFHLFLSLGVSSCLFSSLSGSSGGILVVFRSVGTSNVLVFALRLSCGSPRGVWRRGGPTQTHNTQHTTHTTHNTQHTTAHNSTQHNSTQTKQQHTHTPHTDVVFFCPEFSFCPNVVFFFFLRVCFVCPVCRFLFCPQCLFFLSRLRFFFVPTTGCLFCPVSVFFCPATVKYASLSTSS